MNMRHVWTMILLLAGSGWLSAGEPAGILRLERLGQAKKVLPIYYQNNDIWFTNIKLPVVILVNTDRRPVRLADLAVSGLAGGREVVRLRLDAPQVENAVRATAKLLNGLGNDETGRYFRAAWFGAVPEAGKPFCADALLAAGGRVALDLFRALPFVYGGERKVDGLALEVAGMAGGRRFLQRFVIPLVDYTVRGAYIFPVKGSVTVGSLPLGYSHRGAHAQEFALDILDIRRLDGGEFSTSTHAGEGEQRVVQLADQAADYHIYDREVVAAAAGVVVEVGRGFPDELAADPRGNFMQRIADLTPRLRAQGVGLRNIRNGNYVIIDHGNGEFSLSCHLRENIPVQAGQRVAQGQEIGRVGNSGLSMEPHLHFQLMDGADPGTANGLPVLFTDLSLGAVLDSPFMGERNTLLYSEFLFMTVR